MTVIDPIQGGRVLQAAIEPLRAAATAGDVEGATVLNAHVFTSANVTHRVGQFSSRGSSYDNGFFHSSGGSSSASGTLDQIVGQQTRRGFAVRVVNVRPVPAGITDVQAAMDHLDDALRADPKLPAGAVVQGRDGKLALGDLAYADTFPYLDRAGDVQSTTIDEVSRPSSWPTVAGRYDYLGNRPPTEVSDTERQFLPAPESVSRRLLGEQPTIHNLDLSGDPVPSVDTEVDPATIDLGARVHVQTKQGTWYGGSKWVNDGSKDVVVHPTKATESTYHGQPLEPGAANTAVGLERIDKSIKGVVGHDGRMQFAD